MIPTWAPNLHPLIVHFPIVLLITAVVIDLIDVFLQRPAWLGAAAASLYAAGAVSAIVACFTVQGAASTVFVPGMALPIVDDHRTWALATAWYVGVTTTVRVMVRVAGFPRSRGQRTVLLVAGLVGVLLLQQAAQRGARLVYEQGVGVIVAPASR